LSHGGDRAPEDKEKKMADMAELVEAVKAHATANYDSKFGWDVIVECYSDSEIAELITEGHAKTAIGAIRVVGRFTSAYASHRDDIIGTAF
jgi:hypothetical protein